MCLWYDIWKCRKNENTSTNTTNCYICMALIWVSFLQGQTGSFFWFNSCSLFYLVVGFLFLVCVHVFFNISFAIALFAFLLLVCGVVVFSYAATFFFCFRMFFFFFFGLVHFNFVILFSCLLLIYIFFIIFIFFFKYISFFFFFKIKFVFPSVFFLG